MSYRRREKKSRTRNFFSTRNFRRKSKLNILYSISNLNLSIFFRWPGNKILFQSAIWRKMKIFQNWTRKFFSIIFFFGNSVLGDHEKSSNRKWKWTDLNSSAVWRGPECPRGKKRSTAVSIGLRTSRHWIWPETDSFWPSEGHGYSNDIFQTPKIDSRKILHWSEKNHALKFKPKSWYTKNTNYRHFCRIQGQTKPLMIQ